MEESVGGCGNSDEFGDVCGESDYRSGELAINLCEQCTIANLRANLKSLSAELGRVRAERDGLKKENTWLQGAIGDNAIAYQKGREDMRGEAVVAAFAWVPITGKHCLLDSIRAIPTEGREGE